MLVQPIKNNTNFGTCRGIVCLREFSPKTVPAHASMVDTFCKSQAFQELGEKIDFIANFIYYRDLAQKTYKLVLAPVDYNDTKLTNKNKQKCINLPITASVASCTEELPLASDCENDFMKILQAVDTESLNWDLNTASEEQAKLLQEEMKYMSGAKYERTWEKAETHGIPIYY